MKYLLNQKSFFITTITSFIFLTYLPDIVFSATDYFVPEYPPQSDYEINVKIRITDKVIITGREIIKFSNSSKKEINKIAISWPLSDFSAIQCSVEGYILSLLNGYENKEKPAVLIYSLKEPVKPGDKIQLNVEFSSDLICDKNDEIKLLRWYPKLWWDDLDSFDSYKIKLDTPEGYALAISGRLNNKTGMYENEGIRTCGLYLHKDLLSEQKEIEGVLITSLHTEDGSRCAQLCMETAADVITFYKGWLGFYPFKFLYILPGAERPMGGYPFATGMVIIHGQQNFDQQPLLHWKWITAHEIGHQYWGGYVFDDFNSWLWIGLGVYMDRAYTIHRNLGLDKHTGMMDKYIAGVMKKYDTTADLTPSQIEKLNFDYNNIIQHGKGFSIISALECTLGKDTFLKIYRRCLKEYKGKYLNYNTFRDICEKESGENLSWFFDQWVRSDKYLLYEIISQDCKEQDKKYISTVEVKRTGTLSMPVPVKAVFDDGSSKVEFTNRLLETSKLTFISDSKLKTVILDPDKKLAMVPDTLFLSPEELIQRIEQLPWQGVPDEANLLFLKAKQMQLRDRHSWYKLGILSFDGKNIENALFAFHISIFFDPNDFKTLVWLGQMNDLNGYRDKAMEFYKKALEQNNNETIHYDQFGFTFNRKWVEERLSIPFTFR